MRKLAIDLTYQPTGGTLAQIIQVITNIDSYDFDKVVFYLTQENTNLFKDNSNNKIVLKYVSFSNQSIILRAIWAQMVLPFLLILHRVDVLFCPGNISPILNSKKKAQWIGTIGPFESGFISFFSFKNKIILIVTKYLMIFSSFTSDMVIFESNYTRDLFLKNYRQKIKKSSVIHIGNDTFFKPVDTYNSDALSQNKHKNFILTVSHLYPYKNIELLIESFYNLQLQEKGICILVAGAFSDEAYFNKLNLMINKFGISEYIIFLGRLESEDLRELYSQCKIFVFTSPYENFAYTLVEAMSCAAPIIATNTTAMPETCGNAALYFSPNSEKELSSCITTFLNDEKIRLNYKKMALLKSNEYDVYSEVNNKTNKLLSKLF